MHYHQEGENNAGNGYWRLSMSGEGKNGELQRRQKKEATKFGDSVTTC